MSLLKSFSRRLRSNLVPSIHVNLCIDNNKNPSKIAENESVDRVLQVSKEKKFGNELLVLGVDLKTNKAHA